MDDQNDETTDSLWASTVPDSNGLYVVTVHRGEDTVRAFDRAEATAYARAVITAAQRAVYDAAVMRQMAAMDLPLEVQAQAVLDLRMDRNPVDPAATDPWQFTPIVSARDQLPYVTLTEHGKKIGQLTPHEAIGHAVHVLQGDISVDLDTTYLRYLTGQVGIDGERARAVVGALAQHVPEDATGNDDPDMGTGGLASC